PVIDHIVLLFLACCFILFSYSSSSLPPSSCLYPFSLHDALPIYSCRQMTSVKLSGDNITIGVSAFSECETLEKVEIIGNLTSVYVGAFSLSPNRLSSATIYYESGAEAFEKACKTYPNGTSCTLKEVGLSEDNFPAKT